jgi:GNAT superfamily N-acetyltransferase
MGLALSACQENGLTRPNPEKLLREIWPSLHCEGGIMGVVGEDTLEAAILLRVEPHWYSDDLCLLERAIFVHPDFRKSKIGRAKLLCEFAKKAADNLKIPLVIGILSSQRVEAKIKLYARQFGEPSGAYWIYGATTGQSQGN